MSRLTLGGRFLQDTLFPILRTFVVTCVQGWARLQRMAEISGAGVVVWGGVRSDDWTCTGVHRVSVLLESLTTGAHLNVIGRCLLCGKCR